MPKKPTKKGKPVGNRGNRTAKRVHSRNATDKPLPVSASYLLYSSIFLAGFLTAVLIIILLIVLTNELTKT